VFDGGSADNAATGWCGGFDLVVGNPPFLNQLGVATSTERGLANLARARWGDAAKGYADTSVLFLALGCDIARPDGGRVALLQPDSFLSSRDAKAMRHHLLARASLDALWVAGEKVFDASVLTCAPTLRVGGPRQVVLRRSVGRGFSALAPRVVDCDRLQVAETWAPLVAEGFGIPAVPLATGRTLGDLCAATADFRDQYYGIAPFVVEAAADHDPARFPPLVTAGLIDPARLLWGTRPTRFNKCSYEAPSVDLAALESGGDLGPWARSRLVPKILLATQTRVLEVVVDHRGALLPSVPVITITAEPERLYHVAAVLLSPPVTAWAATEYFGAALASGALKLSAAQVRTLPAPAPSAAWDRAADVVRGAMEAADAASWRTSLVELGTLMCDAFGLDDDTTDALVTWWSHRLPAWR
jgi:hypothetical protein